jgi:hypothetical protein
MAARYKIDPLRFTVVLTSCGRFDLLEDTVVSFAKHYDVERIIVAEDSGDASAALAFAARHPIVDMRVNTPRLGQMKSIDKLYSEIKTPFVIHLEDDWHFERGCDLDRLANILDARCDFTVLVSCYREYPTRYDRRAERTKILGVPLKVFPLDVHPEWFSYSFNPTVVPMRNWHEFGPFERAGTEGGLSLIMKRAGKTFASIAESTGFHTGEDRHIDDPHQPLRAKGFFPKLLRSIRKRGKKVAGWFGARS